MYVKTAFSEKLFFYVIFYKYSSCFYKYKLYI